MHVANTVKKGKNKFLILFVGNEVSLGGENTTIFPNKVCKSNS